MVSKIWLYMALRGAGQRSVDGAREGGKYPIV
jgi:hypothetical protein